MISSLKELCDASVDQDILDQVEKTILQLKVSDVLATSKMVAPGFKKNS